MLAQNNTGLIVIDIQGKLAKLVQDSNTLISNTEKLIKGAKVLCLPIIVLEQNPSKLGSTTEELSILLDTVSPISKFSFNACEEPALLEAMNNSNIKNWLICGIEAHICVYQTVLSLFLAGIKVQVVSDCISSRKLENKQLAIQKLLNLGVEITSLEMCLYEIMKDCKNPKFKEILPLIK